MTGKRERKGERKGRGEKEPKRKGPKRKKKGTARIRQRGSGRKGKADIAPSLEGEADGGSKPKRPRWEADGGDVVVGDEGEVEYLVLDGRDDK